jgi:hypothetical protein
MDPARQPQVVLFETTRAPEFGVDYRPDPAIDPVQRYGRDTARIPTQGNIPGRPQVANLVALNNLGNLSVGIDSVIAASATHFWRDIGIDAAFYGPNNALNIYGFRAKPDFVALIGIANAQQELELRFAQNRFLVTPQHLGLIDERTMN